MASVRDYVKRRRVIRRRVVRLGEPIDVKIEYRHPVTNKLLYKKWEEGVVTHHNGCQIEVSFWNGDQYTFHPEDDYNGLRYTREHYNTSADPDEACKVAAAVLKACRANGESTFIAPANAINVEQDEPVAESEDDTTEDLDSLD